VTKPAASASNRSRGRAGFDPPDTSLEPVDVGGAVAAGEVGAAVGATAATTKLAVAVLPVPAFVEVTAPLALV
jgi:hypothetical protein